MRLLVVGCGGVGESIINVFAKFAADYIFDELYTIDIKDGGNLEDPGGGKDDVVFGFNV